jgi:hypothetical protein
VTASYLLGTTYLIVVILGYRAVKDRRRRPIPAWARSAGRSAR